MAYKKILVPMDGSQGAWKAFRFLVHTLARGPAGVLTARRSEPPST